MSDKDFSQISTIIFDLDGTLYEDTHHFAYYADKIKNKLPTELQEAFQREYDCVISGNHTLKIGRMYDLKEDKILVVIKGEVKEAFEWEGKPLTKETINKLYPNSITIDMDRFFSIGDMWWVPSTIGRHLGLKTQDTQQSFLETREFMKGPDFKMNPVEGFKELLYDLRELGINLILLTNSPEPDSEAILDKLGISEVFSKKIFNGRKPTKTVEHFYSLKEEFQSDFSQMLSVGDNWLNEILPATDLGMPTIFIDSHGIGHKDSADVVVKTVGEAITNLKENLILK